MLTNFRTETLLFCLLLLTTSFQQFKQQTVKAASIGTRGDQEMALPRPSSVSGVTFATLTSDGAGGAWIGGSVLNQAMLVHLNEKVSTLTLPENSAIKDLGFVDDQHGWALTSYSTYRTVDGGQNWKRLPRNFPAKLNQLCFIDQHTGWIVGDSNTILFTKNAGKNWAIQKVDDESNLLHVQFVDAHAGWILGSTQNKDFRSNTFFKTSDGGDTWNKVAGAPSLYAFHFLNGSEGWAVDVDNNILNTRDGGVTWNSIRKSSGPMLNSIYFINREEGWAAGDGILKTTDGGATWKYSIAPFNADGSKIFDKIYFDDTSKGWALGTFRILTSDNGGFSWSVAPDDWKSRLVSMKTSRR